MVTLNLDPIENIDNIDYGDILEQAKSIIGAIETSWGKVKLYNQTIDVLKQTVVGTQTYHKENLNGSYWAARCSDLNVDEKTMKAIHDKMLRYLVGSFDKPGENHSDYEKEYIHELYEVFSKSVDPKNRDSRANSFTYLAKVYYKFQFPLKKRVFYELIHIVKLEDNSEVYIISMAVNPSIFGNDADSECVVGRYTSIEKIAYDKEKKDLKWIMCTCSDPGGFVPEWLTKLGISKAISKDVPSFLEWAFEY